MTSTGPWHTCVLPSPGGCTRGRTTATSACSSTRGGRACRRRSLCSGDTGGAAGSESSIKHLPFTSASTAGHSKCVVHSHVDKSHRVFVCFQLRSPVPPAVSAAEGVRVGRGLSRPCAALELLQVFVQQRREGRPGHRAQEGAQFHTSAGVNKQLDSSGTNKYALYIYIF